MNITRNNKAHVYTLVYAHVYARHYDRQACEKVFNPLDKKKRIMETDRSLLGESISHDQWRRYRMGSGEKNASHI